VRITRPRHPFEGKALAVFGRRHHQSKPHLILILPDGSRSLIPTEWTDLDSSTPGVAAVPKQNPHLGFVADLLHTRAVVDALLHRRPHPMATTKNLFARRTTIVQRNLNFLDLPIPEAQVWETLKNEQRAVAIEVLARLIAQATDPSPKQERDHD
jgi:hypothetical protein